MQNTYSLNINELTESFINDLKKNHKDKNIEIVVAEEETTYLTKSPAMKNRIDDSRKRTNGENLGEVIEKYNL